MKVGIIGLGDIAQKAYLPLITQRQDLELYFCTRTESTLKQLGAKYKVDRLFNSIDELIKEDLDAAFVHAATEAHYILVKKLLEKGINTFVDKPITYHLQKTKELIELAQSKDLILMTGFNRRYVPTYTPLFEIASPKTIIMEKNRTYQPGAIRSFILDDFIHVIDTIIYLMGTDTLNLEQIDFKKVERKNKLLQVNLMLRDGENMALGIMNRDNPITEESLEVIALNKKKKIKNITQIIDYDNEQEKYSQTASWNKMGYNRGFVDLIDEFLIRVKDGQNKAKEVSFDLLTHQIAEKIITK